MKKLRIIIFTILLIIPTFLNALEINDLYSKNILVYDLDEDLVLYEKNSNTKTPIASLTKVMTALVSIENIKDLDETITITYEMLENVPWDASVAGLSVGDKVTYRDLLYATMLPSGADAADSLAVSLFGSVDKFVDAMNKKAKELNLENTHFVDTTGLDERGLYSTAKDLANLLKEALKNETFKNVFETKSYITTNNMKLTSTLDSYNKRLGIDFSYVLGSKTGYNDEAGLCLITLSNINNENIITVSINAPVDDDHNKNVVDLNTLYNTVKNNFNKELLYEKGDTLYTLKTKYAKELEININAKEDINKFVLGELDESLIKIAYEGEDNILYNTLENTKLGTIKVYYDDYLAYQEDVILENKLNFSLWEFIKTEKYYIMLGLAVVLLLCLFIKGKKKKKRRRK